MVKPVREFDPDALDRAAEAAGKELEKFNPETLQSFADWWVKHFSDAGHKRLFKQVRKYASK